MDKEDTYTHMYVYINIYTNTHTHTYIYTYNRILFNHKKKMSFAATWMGLEIIKLNEVRQRQILYDNIYM